MIKFFAPVSKLTAILLFAAVPSIAADLTARLALGKALFSNGSAPACSICHALKDADANGAVGPALDELKPDAARVEKALRNGLGQMPSYKDKLTEEQIAALALYVSKASSGK